jgi:steroid delta-isomerase-like uncharacterized protein
LQHDYRDLCARIDGLNLWEDAMTKWSGGTASLLAVSLLACAVQEKKQSTAGDKAIVDAYVRAWNQHDSIAIDTLLGPNGIHEDIAQNFRGKGGKEVVAFMRGLLSVEPDFKWTVTDAIEDGNFVALEWTWTATYTGPDPSGKPVTRKRISGRGASFADVESGKIRRFTDYYDAASFFR